MNQTEREKGMTMNTTTPHGYNDSWVGPDAPGSPLPSPEGGKIIPSWVTELVPSLLNEHKESDDRCRIMCRQAAQALSLLLASPPPPPANEVAEQTVMYRHVFERPNEGHRDRGFTRVVGPNGVIASEGVWTYGREAAHEFWCRILNEETSARIRRLEAELAECKDALPPTFFADRSTSERFVRIVHGWQRAVSVTNVLEEQLATARSELERVTGIAGLLRLEAGVSAQQLATAQGRAGRLEEALNEIDAIRKDIISNQSLGWSRHVYPLVATLDAALSPAAAGEGGGA